MVQKVFPEEPVVFLDLGAGRLVDETCGLKVDTCGLNEEEAVSRLADWLNQLAVNSKRISELSKRARESINEFTWSSIVGRVMLDNYSIRKLVS